MSKFSVDKSSVKSATYTLDQLQFYGELLLKSTVLLTKKDLQVVKLFIFFKRVSITNNASTKGMMYPI